MTESASQTVWHSTRYRVERELGRGGMGVVYRAYDRLTRRSVALKRIEQPEVSSGVSVMSTAIESAGGRTSEPLSLTATIPSEPLEESNPASHQRLALAQEFRILASLRHPHIISVLDYGFDERGRSYLVMELLEGARTLTQAGLDSSMDQRIALLGQLMQALRYLHRAGVVHGDLKPANVLVVETDGQLTVKVVDFGVALRMRQEENQARPAGTMAYMAPESLRGAPLSKASDAYALGMVCLELCSGRHPLAQLSADELLAGSHRPFFDVEALFDKEGARLPAEARALIVQLLAHDPRERLQDIDDVLMCWCAATGLQAPQEPLAIRNSFLRVSRFVGRKQELRKLTDALDAARRQRGSAWIVSGVSGIGKSRLLEEVRAVARVRGMLVLHGCATDTGGQSFSLWRDVLREVALCTELSDFEASVLSELVRDLDRVLDRPIAEPPPLSHDGNLRRLMNTVEAVFERLEMPALLLLEDLHWATPESAALLKRLIGQAAGRPLMLLGSMRSDERPAWVDGLAGTYEMRLLPFADDLVSAMCASILGAGAEVAAPIMHASRGNAFFIVELLRSLAEDHGSLDDAAQELLSKHTDRSPEALLRRRLGRVPAAAQEPLALAAVAGRQLDLDMLAAVVDDVPGWLQTCAVASVLEIVEGRWRFCHDKLREQLLAQLSDAERRRLHGQVADALEQVYGADTSADGAAPAATMAFHREAAGQLSAALPHLVNAAEASLRQGALQDAYHQAERALRYAQDASSPPLMQARIRLVIIDTSHGLQHPERSIHHCIALLQEVGLGAVTRRPARLAMAGQLLRSLRVVPLPQTVRAHEAEVLKVVLKALRICIRVHVMLDQPEQGLSLLLLTYNLCRSLGLADKAAAARCGIAYALSMTPARTLSQPLLSAAGRVIEEQGNDPSMLLLLESRALISINLGRWRSAGRHLEGLELLARSRGDERRQCFAMLQASFALHARGELQQAQSKLDELSRFDASSDDHQLRSVALNRKGWLALHRGDLEQARAAFEEGLQGEVMRLPQLALMGGLAQTLWLEGRAPHAERHALATLGMVLSARLSGHAGLFMLPAVAQVLLAYQQQKPEPTRLHGAQLALKELRRYSRQFPMGEPSYLRLNAQYALLQGRPKQARQQLQQSIASAKSLGMVLHQAIATLELAQLDPTPLLHKQARAAAQLLRDRHALGCFGLLLVGEEEPPDTI